MSDTTEQSAPGVQSGGTLQFEANYTKENWKAVQAVCDGAQHKFGLYFDTGATGLESYTPTGNAGISKFSGEVSAYINGASTNEARKMTIVVYLQSEIEYVEQ